MKITRYGITLERVREEQIEMLRQWRNDEKIARYMFYKGQITAAMQREWFASVNNEENFFFVIHYHDTACGLINISSIDWENKTAYTGLFIYEDTFLGSDVPVSASLAMLDVFFLLFDIQLVYAKVKGDNPVAHRYNSSLGFTRTKKIELGQGDEYMLQKELYLLATKELRNAAMHLKGNKTILEFDTAQEVDKWMLDKMQHLKKEAEVALQLEVRCK